MILKANAISCVSSSLILILTMFQNSHSNPVIRIQTLEAFKQSINYVEPAAVSRNGNSENIGNTEICTSRLTNRNRNTMNSAINGNNYRWTALHFYVDPAFDTFQKNRITQSLIEIRSHSCVDMFFIGNRVSSGFDYIFIRKGVRGSGCESSIGKQGNEHVVNLETPGCDSKGTILHEIMHAMGYWHEQNRPDRDNFVTVYPQFIEPGKYYPNFIIASTSLTFGLPYDQISIMHYSGFDFSIDNIHPTIVAKNGRRVGSTGELTEIDKKKLKIITGCPVEGMEWIVGADGIKWNFNCDFWGNDIHSQTNTRGEDCGGLCLSRSGCVRFAWRSRDGGTCWLKNGNGNSVPSRGDNIDGVCGFVTAVNWRDGDGGLLKWDFNCDFSGNDIHSQTNTRGEDCGGLCRRRGGCVRFAWRTRDGGTCWLKNGNGNSVPSRGNNVDGICGFITESTAVNWRDGDGGVLKWDFNCDFWGNDFHTQTNTRGEDCGGLCRRRTGCVRFAWRTRDGGTCWLKNGNGNSVPSRGNNVDGICGFLV